MKKEPVPPTRWPALFLASGGTRRAELGGAAIDENDCANDHGRGDEDMQGDGFAAEEPAEQDGYDGIDVGMRGHERGRIVFKEPVVCGEGNHRAEDNEIGE